MWKIYSEFFGRMVDDILSWSLIDWMLVIVLIWIITWMFP